MFRQACTGLVVILSVTALAYMSSLYTATARDKVVSIYVPTETGWKSIDNNIVKNSQNRLDIELFEPDPRGKAQYGEFTQLPAKFAFSFQAEVEPGPWSAAFDPNVDKFNSLSLGGHIKNLNGAYWGSFEVAPILAANDTFFWFPFDSFENRWRVNMQPAVKWDEIAIKDLAKTFSLSSRPIVEYRDGVLSLQMSYQRNIEYRAGFVILVLAAASLTFAFLAVVKRRWQLLLLWIFLGLSVGVVYWWLFPKGFLQPLNFANILVFSLIGLSGIALLAKARIHSSPAYSVFISYRWRDSLHAVDRVYENLSRLFVKKQIFRDFEALAKGEDFLDAIDQAINECEIVLVFIGYHWLGDLDEESGYYSIHSMDDYPRAEIESAIKAGKKIIPVLVDQAEMPLPNQLPESLKELPGLNALRLRGGDEFQTDMRKLIDRLRNEEQLLLQKRKT